MTATELVCVDGRNDASTKTPAHLLTDIVGGEAQLAVREGITDLLIAFPAGVQQEFSDKRRMAQIYYEACAGHCRFVVEQSLRHLRFHNPRNPFPPTPQDLFELCNKMRDEWESMLGNYYFGGAAWAPRATYDSNYKLHKSFAADFGGEPGSIDCIVPDAVVISFLRSFYTRYDRMMFNRIIDLSDEHFARLPRETFTDEGYRILAEQQSRHSRMHKQYEAECDEHTSGAERQVRTICQEHRTMTLHKTAEHNQASGFIHWHAFTVQPRKEFAVREILARRGIASFVPIETKLVRASARCRRKVLREFPLCPSYIFIPFFEGDWQTWETVRNLRHGINSVVAVAGRPARIDPDGMAHLIQLSGQQLVDGGARSFKADDKVRIAAGPMQGFEGFVESARKGRAIIELLNSGRLVDLPMSLLVSTDMPVAEQPYLFGQNRKVPDVPIAEVREHADSHVRISVPA